MQAKNNSNHFDVEQSPNGSLFNKVAEIKSMNIATGATYKYLFDKVGSGSNYFRLKAVDNDGYFTYSQTVELKGSDACGGNMQINIFPNPTKEMLNIKGLIIGISLQLFDINGRKLTEIIASSNNITMKIGMYAKGVYNLRIKAASGSVANVKVIKSNFY